jgi:TatD DNase family protein
MIIDTHAHYESERFEEDREELLASLWENGVGKVIDVGAAYKDLAAVVALAKKYPFIYAAIGVHPYEIGDLNEETWEEVRRLSLHPRCVAIGEIGLDYHEWPDEPPLTEETREAQKEWFRRQLDLARERKLPFIIHSRDAAADTMQILKERVVPGMTGVMHCYAYSVEVARTLVDMGLYLGIGGVVTFKNAKKLKEVVKAAPLDRLLLETDCPYMAPEPHRGKRNSSLYLPLVVKAIAELRGITSQEVIAATQENAMRLFPYLSR